MVPARVEQKRHLLSGEKVALPLLLAFLFSRCPHDPETGVSVYASVFMVCSFTECANFENEGREDRVGGERAGTSLSTQKRLLCAGIMCVIVVRHAPQCPWSQRHQATSSRPSRVPLAASMRNGASHAGQKSPLGLNSACPSSAKSRARLTASLLPSGAAAGAQRLELRHAQRNARHREYTSLNHDRRPPFVGQ
jgi:hypothetical protein